MRYEEEALDRSVTIRMCPSCYGARKTDCTACRRRHADAHGNSCAKCLGSGRVKCTACDGQGRIRM